MDWRSDLEAAFDHWWHVLGGPELVVEHRFCPGRRWRLDRAHVGAAVAVELHGAVYVQGRHTRGAGFERDRAKMNAATAAGWAVFELTRGMLDSDPAGCLAPIMTCITERLAAADHEVDLDASLPDFLRRVQKHDEADAGDTCLSPDFLARVVAAERALEPGVELDSAEVLGPFLRRLAAQDGGTDE